MFKSKKNRFLSLASLTLAASLVLSACGGASTTSNSSEGTDASGSGGEKVKLTMFIWAGSNQDVVPKEVVAEYVKEHPNVEVTFEESTNSVMYPKMVAGKQANPDDPIVNFGYFNADATAKGLNDDMWEPLDTSIVTNIKDIPEQFHQPDNKGIVWGVSSFALVYNKDLVQTPPTSWNDLWENEQFKGKTALWDYMFYSYISPLIAVKGQEIGASYDNPEPAFQYVADHSDQVGTLVTSNDQLKALLESGDALIAPFSAQVAQTWIDAGSPLAVAYPEEGAISFPYSLQVVKGSTPEQTRVANEIINELLNAESLTSYADATGTPVTSTTATVPDKYKDDPSFSVETQSNGINPDWDKLAQNSSAWKELWDRLVKTKLQ
ncbi:spermidine/putrescine ABC transporter substrate-binding protein [Paenibacillus sp. Root52]|uniref:Spermidine/putrescine transport system substrate-binding protein n=1 Tax=Paenibacillus amylolyticus TaxID=1451 RepID=A0AAP5GYL6_PAEAM|nr:MULTISPECIES: extracellular solute-binding protein [Paenibacillus]KQY94298.1 spermidine/putrescine ABC transporter substrate-binding protein [Paenibacillus sp. Root52]MDR6721721.1 putative spermidine/putrescine transport system substrate-binding protein [Paenibacillus amylolyticus]